MSKLLPTIRIAKAVQTLVDTGQYRPGHLYEDCIAPAAKGAIEAALSRTNGNLSHAAQLLGVDRNTLRARMKALGVGRVA